MKRILNPCPRCKTGSLLRGSDGMTSCWACGYEPPGQPESGLDLKPRGEYLSGSLAVPHRWQQGGRLAG